MGVAIFQNALGELAPVQLAAPALVADYTLDEFSITGELTRETDNAPGLSNKLNYGRNYAPHSIDDLTLLPPTTTLNTQLRTELSSDDHTVTTSAVLHALYDDAKEREPLGSLLSDTANAQTEIDRLCGLYTVPRAFYTCRARIDAAYAIEPGHTVALTHSRYLLTGGKNLLVVLARSDFLGNSVDLVLWG